MWEKFKDWTLVEGDLVKRYGAKKKTTVRRWCAMARQTDDQVISAASGKFPLGMVLGNNFLVGEASQRLSVDYALVALGLLERKPGTTVAMFQRQGLY